MKILGLFGECGTHAKHARESKLGYICFDSALPTLVPDIVLSVTHTALALMPSVSNVDPGGHERLPQLGFNAMNGGLQLPFPEDLPINRETLLHFAAAFLNGRLQSSIDARKAMVVSRPFSTHNTVRRNEKRAAPEAEIRGVSEKFKPKDAIVQARRPKSVHEK